MDKKQSNRLYRHLSQEMDRDYAAFVTQLIKYDCENYLNHLDFISGELPDYSEIIDATQTVIDSLHATITNHLKKPDELQLLQYLHTLQAGQDLTQSLKPGRGTPKKTHRDDIIRNIYNYYPDGTAKITVGSHFERTVEIVLDFLEPPLKDIHRTIRIALYRGK
jgi:hypothetical protein